MMSYGSFFSGSITAADIGIYAGYFKNILGKIIAAERGFTLRYYVLLSKGLNSRRFGLLRDNIVSVACGYLAYSDKHIIHWGCTTGNKGLKCNHNLACYIDGIHTELRRRHVRRRTMYRYLKPIDTRVIRTGHYYHRADRHAARIRAAPIRGAV